MRHDHDQHERCITKDEFRDVLRDALEEHFRVSLLEHGDQHAWLRAQIERQKLANDRNRRLLEAMASFLCIGALGWFLTIVQEWVGKRFY